MPGVFVDMLKQVAYVFDRHHYRKKMVKAVVVIICLFLLAHKRILVFVGEIEVCKLVITVNVEKSVAEMYARYIRCKKSIEKTFLSYALFQSAATRPLVG